jgi:5-(carboxyamino)imidazole ribonucleotide mutase
LHPGLPLYLSAAKLQKGGNPPTDRLSRSVCKGHPKKPRRVSKKPTKYVFLHPTAKNQKPKTMTPSVSIIMGSTSDMPVMEAAASFLDEMEIPFEINALSAHRTPEKVMAFAEGAEVRGIRVIIAAAGGAAHLPGVIAASTTLPVIGVPVNSSISIDGWDSILSILQMPAGIPVATVALDGARNAAILAMQILALSDENVRSRLKTFKKDLKKKVVKANEDLRSHQFRFRV